MRFLDSGVLGCGRGKEPCPARSEGSAGGAERALRERGSCSQGRRGLSPPPDLRETEAAPPPRAEEGGAAGAAGSGACRGSGSGRDSDSDSDSGGETELQGARSRAAARFAPAPQRCPDRRPERPDRQTGPGAAL